MECCWATDSVKAVLLEKDGAVLLPTAPLARGGVPRPPAMAGFPSGDVLGDALAEGWLQTSPPSSPREAQTLEANAGGRSLRAAEDLPPDCSFANTQGKVHKNTPSRCYKELGSCSSRLPWGVFPGQQCIHQAPPKTMKTCTFFMVCM